MDDDDWELFVPVIGEHYPEEYQYRYKKSRTQWSDYFPGDPGVLVQNPATDTYQYRRPKQKENNMPDRTPQQAMKDAIDSGAVEAWINGEDIQCDAEGIWKDYERREGLTPNFQHSGINWRPTSPEPTRINWRPVVTGKEPKGVAMGYWGPETAVSTLFKEGEWRNPKFTTQTYNPPTHWAPMCNLPE